MRLFTVFVCTGHLLDILSPVNATASSSYKAKSGLRFAPQLAIQADTGYVWANCFASTKQQNPWFTLQFRSLTSIFNVRLGVQDERGGMLPGDYALSGMNKLSVYVSKSSNLPNDKTLLCGSPWNYTQTKIIEMICERKLTGKFMHVTVPSSTRKYLVICNIVLNKDDGTVQHIVQ